MLNASSAGVFHVGSCNVVVSTHGHVVSQKQNVVVLFLDYSYCDF